MTEQSRPAKPVAGPEPSFPVRKRHVLAALTDKIRDEFMTLGTEMYAIRDRQERSKEFKKRLGSLPQETRDVIEQMIQKEEQHKRYMDKLLHVAPGFSMEGRKPHDYSKDELFCFVMSFHFDCQTNTDEMKSLARDEFRNHYQHEPHHPEWEGENNKECTDMDIREMAIDRLARNLQRNDGFLNDDQMMEFLPKFPLGDNEGKQKIYLKYVKEYTSLVREAYVPRPDDKKKF